MKNGTTIRILCVVLVLTMMAGIVLLVAGGARRLPDSPLKDSADELLAEPLDGGSTAQREQKEAETPPEEEPEEEPEEPPDEEPEEPPEEEQEETGSPPRRSQESRSRSRNTSPRTGKTGSP
jgi:outer membrane biosynthesis protein TonB